MDVFANETPENRDEAFRQAAAELGFAKAIVEKDFWVCWSLQHLFALPSFRDHLMFKGDTSLSKAYDVINRFSEDVDRSLDRAQLGFEGDRDPENPDLSGGKRKSLLLDLQEAAEATVSGPCSKKSTPLSQRASNSRSPSRSTTATLRPSCSPTRL